MTVSLSPSSSLWHPGASTGYRHRGPPARQFWVAKRLVWGRSLFFLSFFFALSRLCLLTGCLRPSHPAAPTVVGRCHHLLCALTADATGYRPGDNELTGALQRDFISSASSPSACSPEQDGTRPAITWGHRMRPPPPPGLLGCRRARARIPRHPLSPWVGGFGRACEDKLTFYPFQRDERERETYIYISAEIYILYICIYI